MKKILIAAMACFAMAAAYSKEVITVVYAFGAGDTMSNYTRALIHQANAIQDRYTFVFEAKPGAGGYIASKYVASTPNTILATSSAFFVRPNFYPNESHNLNDFRALMIQTTAPMSAASIKYQSWKDIPLDANISIGVSGLGVVSHLSSIQIKTKYPNAMIVPFKSTSDAFAALLSGNLDITIGFMGEQERWTSDNTKKVSILGITGAHSVNSRPTYISAGFPAVFAKMNNTNHLVVPKTMPDTQVVEFRKILQDAAQASVVTDTYKVNFGAPVVMDNTKLDAWYLDQVEHWAKMSDAAKSQEK